MQMQGAVKVCILGTAPLSAWQQHSNIYGQVWLASWLGMPKQMVFCRAASCQLEVPGLPIPRGTASTTSTPQLDLTPVIDSGTGRQGKQGGGQGQRLLLSVSGAAGGLVPRGAAASARLGVSGSGEGGGGCTGGVPQHSAGTGQVATNRATRTASEGGLSLVAWGWARAVVLHTFNLIFVFMNVMNAIVFTGE